jgi:hypothetical protein
MPLTLMVRVASTFGYPAGAVCLYCSAAADALDLDAAKSTLKKLEMKGEHQDDREIIERRG